ncbi:MAG: adenine-specific methyltransferase EcoRI family protein [Clostridia bacterium]|nr:adenine-specific methyltransferase EcoRI family protein [Clostridia bacterium]
MAGNTTLHRASAAKNDEFYTQLTDIEKELKHYKGHFQDKIVFCNCDDPEYSNFWKYFQLNFYYLGLKKLIATHYEIDKPSYKMEIVRQDKGVQMGIPDYVKTPLQENGDFRSDECVGILKEADIVVTNPPFSLFREYLAQLIKNNKKFVIIGNQNVITYKEVFPLLKENKVWFGFNNGAQAFRVPDTFERNNTYIENGAKYAKFGNICWATNLDISKRHEELFLYKNYTPEEYPTYDNYNAINVNKVQDIPCDYFGVMGVPITFMDKYNPEQFEIVGLLNSSTEELAGIPCLKTYIDFREIRQDLSFTGASGGKTNGNPVLRGKPLKGNYYINKNTNETVYSTYARILIRRKQNED